MKPNNAKITCTSTWVHVLTGKFCRITGTREMNDTITTFRIYGHNPLPCFEFKGTYSVLVQWLKGNGWTRVFNTDEYIPDTVYITK